MNNLSRAQQDLEFLFSQGRRGNVNPWIIKRVVDRLSVLGLIEVETRNSCLVIKTTDLYRELTCPEES